MNHLHHDPSDSQYELAIKVSADVALLFEYILDDAQLTWSDLQIGPAEANAVITIQPVDVPRAVLALRQRLGRQLLEVSVVNAAAHAPGDCAVHRTYLEPEAGDAMRAFGIDRTR